MCIEELPQRTHIAPIGVIGRRGPRNLIGIEIINAGLMAGREVRGDVTAHVMLGVLGLLVKRQGLEQSIGIGYVVAHGSEDGIRMIRQTGGGLRLLLEALDHIRMLRVDLDHAELVGLADW